MRKLVLAACAAAALFAASAPSASAAGCPGNAFGQGQPGEFDNPGEFVQGWHDAGGTGQQLGGALHATGGFGTLVRVGCGKGQ